MVAEELHPLKIKHRKYTLFPCFFFLSLVLLNLPHKNMYSWTLEEKENVLKIYNVNSGKQIIFIE
jgi:hypothetical protein